MVPAACLSRALSFFAGLHRASAHAAARLSFTSVFTRISSAWFSAYIVSPGTAASSVFTPLSRHNHHGCARADAHQYLAHTAAPHAGSARHASRTLSAAFHGCASLHCAAMACGFCAYGLAFLFVHCLPGQHPILLSFSFSFSRFYHACLLLHLLYVLPFTCTPLLPTAFLISCHCFPALYLLPLSPSSSVGGGAAGRR